MLRWTARIGAVTAEALAHRDGVTRRLGAAHAQRAPRATAC